MKFPSYSILINRRLKRLELCDKKHRLIAVSKKIPLKLFLSIFRTKKSLDVNLKEYKALKKFNATYYRLSLHKKRREKDIILHHADKKMVNNDLYCTSYVNGIIDNFRLLESVFLPRAERLKAIQNDREKLILWLLDVQIKCKMRTCSFHHAINILDRFLSIKYVPGNAKVVFNKNLKDCLQLIGCTSMWLGAKYNEVNAPDMSDFVYMSDGAFTYKDMKRMEEEIINTLKFNFSTPNSYHFAKRYIHVMQHYMRTDKVKIRLDHLVKYFIEFAIFAPELFGKNYSLIAAGSTMAASYWLDIKFEWKEEMSKAVGYKHSELSWVMKILKELIYNDPKKVFSPLIRKYERAEKGRIALMRYRSRKKL